MSVVGFRGGSGGSLEPPSGTKLFHFHGEIYENSGKMLKTNSVLVDLNPLPEILDPPLNVPMLICLVSQLLWVVGWENAPHIGTIRNNLAACESAQEKWFCPGNVVHTDKP